MGARLFGQKLRELREARGLTRDQFAEATGFSRIGVEQWERGVREPTASNFLSLARALGVPCTYFADALLAPDPPKEPGRRGRPKAG